MDTLQGIFFSIEIRGAFFSLIAALTILLTKHFDKTGSLKLLLSMLCSAALMIIDAVSIYYRGKSFETAPAIERWSTFTVYFLSFLTIPLSAQYVSEIIYKRPGYKLYWECIEWGLFIFGALLLIANEIFPFIYYIDNASRYVTMPLFFRIPNLIGFAGLLTTLAVAPAYSKYMMAIEIAAMVSFLTLPLIGIIIKLFNPESPFVTIAIVFSVIILFVSHEASYVQFLVEKEKKLSEEKLKLVNLQMKPHFIFNTLTLIRFQRLTAPNEAAETVTEFSNYLRGITDYLTEEDCISVEAELDIILKITDNHRFILKGTSKMKSCCGQIGSRQLFYVVLTPPMTELSVRTTLSGADFGCSVTLLYSISNTSVRPVISKISMFFLLLIVD